MKEQIQSGLKSLGFTSYEAKAYIALIETGGGSGYLIAKKSAVPTSKIYQVLDSLIAKNAAYQDDLSENAFLPVKPETLLARLKDDTVKQTSQVLSLIKQYNPETKDVQARMIVGTDKVKQTIKNFVEDAGKELMLTAWTEELDEIQNELKKASGRGRVIILSFEEFSLPHAEVYAHRRPDLVSKESHGRMFLGVSNNKCLSAFFYNDNRSECIVSTSPGFVRIIRDHIIHDISLNKLMLDLPEKYRAKFENELTMLRNHLNP